MYSYPLRFKAGAIPTEANQMVVDAQKHPVLFRPKITDAMSPCTIYADQSASQPLYVALHQEQGEAIGFLIQNPGGAALGQLTASSGHAWELLDEHGHTLATIQEKAAWKNSCLYQLLTLPFDQSFSDSMLKVFAPHRYMVTINGKKALMLREVTNELSDDYILKKSGDFPQAAEAILLVSLMMLLCIKE